MSSELSLELEHLSCIASAFAASSLYRSVSARKWLMSSSALAPCSDLALVLLGDADHVRQLRLLELLVLGLELDVRSLQGAVRGGPRAVGLTRGEALAARADDGLCVLRGGLRRPGHLANLEAGLPSAPLLALLRLTLGLLGEEVVVERGHVSRSR